MTSFERIKIYFTKVSLVVIVIMIFTYLRMSSKPEEFQDLFTDSDTLIIAFCMIGLFFVITGQLGFMVLMWIDKKFSISTDYYINLNNVVEKEWKIVKMSTNSCMIVQKESDKNKRIMLEDWKGKEILEIQNEIIPMKKYFESNTRIKDIPVPYIFIQCLIIIISLGMMIFSITYKHPIALIIYFIGIAGLYTSIVISKNYSEYKKLNTNNNN